MNSEVELTEERQEHITERHPDLLPEYFSQLDETLADPDQVHRSERFNNARMFEVVRGGGTIEWTRS